MLMKLNILPYGSQVLIGEYKNWNNADLMSNVVRIFDRNRQQAI